MSIRLDSISQNGGNTAHYPLYLDGCEANFSAMVLLLPNLPDNLHSALSALRHDPVKVLHSEGHVFDSVSVGHEVPSHHLALGRTGLVSRLEHEDRVSLADNVGSHPPASRLKALQPQNNVS